MSWLSPTLKLMLKTAVSLPGLQGPESHLLEMHKEPSSCSSSACTCSPANRGPCPLHHSCRPGLWAAPQVPQMLSRELTPRASSPQVGMHAGRGDSRQGQLQGRGGGGRD